MSHCGWDHKVNYCAYKAKGCMLQVLKHRMEAMLQAGRSVVLAGDLNIAPYPIDHCDYVRASRAQQESMLLGRPDRAWFRNALQSAEGPFIDLFRFVWLSLPYPLAAAPSINCEVCNAVIPTSMLVLCQRHYQAAKCSLVKPAYVLEDVY